MLLRDFNPPWFSSRGRGYHCGVSLGTVQFLAQYWFVYPGIMNKCRRDIYVTKLKTAYNPNERIRFWCGYEYMNTFVSV